MHRQHGEEPGRCWLDDWRHWRLGRHRQLGGRHRRLGSRSFLVWAGKPPRKRLGDKWAEPPRRMRGRPRGRAGGARRHRRRRRPKNEVAGAGASHPHDEAVKVEVPLLAGQIDGDGVLGEPGARHPEGEAGDEDRSKRSLVDPTRNLSGLPAGWTSRRDAHRGRLHGKAHEEQGRAEPPRSG